MDKEINLFKRIDRFFDKLEDKIRGFLSKYPILYAFVAGVAIVLFWRGIWHTADLFPFLTGPVSIIISVILLLASGLLVSFFIGDSILISGLKKEKKIAEKTEEDIKTESAVIKEIDTHLERIERDLENLKDKIK